MNMKMFSRLLLLSILFSSLDAVRTGTASVKNESGWLEEKRRDGRQFGAEMQHVEHGQQSYAKRAVWGGRAFQHAGRDYYWDEHPGQCDNQVICSVSIMELRQAKNYKQRERRHTFPNERKTNQPTTLETAMVYPEEDVLELKYSNGSEPQRITWCCKRDEVCCKRGCCFEGKDDSYSRKNFWRKYGMVWGIVGGSIGFLCSGFWCCWGIYSGIRGVRSFREPAPYGAPPLAYGPVYPAYMGYNHSYTAQPMSYPAQSKESPEQGSHHAVPKRKRKMGTKQSREKVSTINEEQENY